MRFTSRMTAAALFLTSLTVAWPSLAQDAPDRPPVQVADRRMHRTDLTRPDGWRSPSPRTVREADSPAYPLPAPAPAPEPLTDPYGFASILNSYRASAGLPPVAYDPHLSSWAIQNNAAQCHRGLGHHVNPNCYQNCGWNYADAWSVAIGWINSPGHRENLLAPSITRFGIAYGPGPYWTLNAR
jgi:hypothetical protein